MIGQKNKQKNRPKTSPAKRILHYLIPPLLLIGVAGFPFYVQWIYATISSEFNTILPIILIPTAIWGILTFCAIILAIISIRRLNLHVITYIGIGVIALPILFFLMLIIGYESKITDSLYLPHKSYQLVHSDASFLSRMIYGDRGRIYLYSCDENGIGCRGVHSWMWHDGRRGIVPVANQEPRSEIQIYLDDFLVVYVNGRNIYKIDIETEQAINY